MPFKSLFELNSQNFDLYFQNNLSNISAQSKNELPKDIVFKLFRGGGKVNPRNSSKLSFFAKLYILCRCFRKRIFIVVEDEDKGLSEDEFVKLKKSVKNREYGMDQANELKTNADFVLGSKELCDTFSFLNYVGFSSAYNYLVKAKNTPASKISEQDNQIKYIFKFLINYESQKKKFMAETGILIPEFYVLIALYDGQEIRSSRLHKEIFKRAYQANPTRIKTAYRNLCSKGYVEKFGITNDATVRITPIGRDFIRQLAAKYIINI